MLGAYVIRSLSYSNNGTCISEVEWVLLEVYALMGTTSGMGHWWEGIRIINDIDYYYAIIIINIIVPCLSFGCFYSCVPIILVYWVHLYD